MFLLIDFDPIVVNQLTRGRDRKAGIDFGADVFEPQHAIVFPVDPDSSAITRNCLLLERSAFTPSQDLMRKRLLDFVFVNDRAPPAQGVSIDHVELSPAFRSEQFAQCAYVLAG